MAHFYQMKIPFHKKKRSRYMKEVSERIEANLLKNKPDSAIRCLKCLDTIKSSNICYHIVTLRSQYPN